MFAKDTLVFSAISKEKPTKMIAEYKSFLDYIGKEIGQKIEFEFVADYNELTNKLSQGEIDLAYLGPLPYADIKSKNNSIVPIVTFLDKNGQAFYTCSILGLTTHNKKIDDIKRISTSQSLSTCGPMNVNLAYQNKNLPVISTKTSHIDAIVSTLTGESNGASVQTSIAKKYLWHGLTILWESPKYPSFVLVSNQKTINNEIYNKIQKALINIDIKNPAHQQLVSSWGDNIKWGAVSATEDTYKYIIDMAKKYRVKK
jgi:phosphonate transport system substrate-binding protein